MMRGMVIDMNDAQLHTLAQIRAFLDGTVAVEFAVAVEERYGFIARTVRRFGYARLKRAEKAVVLRFLERVSGYSRQQLTVGSLWTLRFLQIGEIPALDPFVVGVVRCHGLMLPIPSHCSRRAVRSRLVANTPPSHILYECVWGSTGYFES